jgi:hypothetical protein
MTVRKAFLIDPDKREKGAEDVRVFLMSMRPNRRVLVEICEYQKKRSDEQNRALWGLAYKILSDHTGNDPEDLHTYFLGEFTGWEVKDVMGQRKRVPKRRSSGMSSVEFAEFFAFIQQRSIQTVGIYIPDPDPNYS